MPFILPFPLVVLGAGGLGALTAADVGVIANLSLWFALHILFGRVAVIHSGPVRLLVADWSTIDGRAVVLSVLAAIAIFALWWSVFRVLSLLAIAGLIIGYWLPRMI